MPRLPAAEFQKLLTGEKWRYRLLGALLFPVLAIYAICNDRPFRLKQGWMLLAAVIAVTALSFLPWPQWAKILLASAIYICAGFLSGQWRYQSDYSRKGHTDY